MMGEKRKPWLKFYPSDWRADPRLRMCSLAARGLWADMIAYMHEGQPYGHLTIDGIAPSVSDIAALVARPVAETRKALSELEEKQVFSRTKEGVIFSRRMVRDKAKADKDRENGKGGGNPALIDEDKRGVNPPVKAHMPEARSQVQKEQQAVPESPPTAARAPSEAIRVRTEIVRIFENRSAIPPDTSRVEVWLAQGYQPELILATVRDIVGRGKAPKILNYFDGPIRDAHEQRNPAPKPKPEILWADHAARWARSVADGMPFWPPTLGAWPGEKGCQCPPEVLRANGIDPDTGKIVQPAAA